MAIVTGTGTTYTTSAIRESLSDVISNISPTETPVLSGSTKEGAQQVFNEFQTDVLAPAVSTNAQLEGFDSLAFTLPAQPQRVGAHQQISMKNIIIAGTTEAVNIAGRKSETAYQMAKKGLELKRDMEKSWLSSIASAAGSTTVARTTPGLTSWIKTNVDCVTAANTPAYTNVPNATRTDGVARTFAVAQLKNVIQLCYVSGAKPDTVLVSPLNKVIASGFVGVATSTAPQSLQKQAVIVGAADVFVSDFGTFTIVPDLFQRDKDAFVLDFSYLATTYLRKMFTKDLAETGDAKKKIMIVEWGTKVKNEASLGLVADLGG